MALHQQPSLQNQEQENKPHLWDFGYLLRINHMIASHQRKKDDRVLYLETQQALELKLAILSSSILFPHVRAYFFASWR